MKSETTLKLVNLHQLGTLTGRGYRKIKEILAGVEPEQKGKEFLYDAYKVLPLIFRSKSEGELDLSHERAKLANAQTEKTIIETEKLKERYIPIEDVRKEWESKVLNTRTKLLLMPKKMSAELRGLTELQDIEDRLEDYIFNALTELSRGE